MLENPETSLWKVRTEEKQDSTAEVFIEKEEVPYKDSDENKRWQGEVGRAVCGLDCCDIGQHKLFVTSANATTNRFGENESIIHKGRIHSASRGPDEDDDEDGKVEDGVKELLVNGCPYSYSKEKVKRQEAVGTVDDEKLSNDQSSKSLNGSISSKQKSKESFNGQTKQEMESEKVAADRSYMGYFTGKLSEAYKNAGRRLQGTRDIVRNVRVGEIKVVLFQYVSKMSKELPLFHLMQPKPEPEPFVAAENKVSLVDLPKDSVSQKCNTSVIPGLSGWPEGSVSSLKNTCPQVFYQRLVQLPPALSQLQSLSSQKILEKLDSLAPQTKVNNLSSIFWLKTASRRQPIPNPGCLLLLEKDIIVLSSKTNSTNTLAISHHFKLMTIKKVQISLAGQHVRLIGCTEDIVLAVFTHSKELTQEFCKALLKALSPEKFSEGIEDHPLLSGDLMVLSLDWTSSVPDIVLDCGLHVTSRFKRVLADLLYIVHGNMDGPGKPSLANVCPLLYTSVKVMNSTCLHPYDIFQFLLTDTHVALLREDGVFHPVPRDSSLVPAQPQFQGLELRERSEIRCLFVRQNDSWLVVDVTFTTRQQKEKKAQSRRGSVDLPSVSHRSRQCDSWKLSFGCTSEAAILINHLCV